MSQRRSGVKKIIKPIFCVERRVARTLHYQDYVTSYSSSDFADSPFKDVKIMRTEAGLCLNSEQFHATRDPGVMGDLDNYKMIIYHRQTVVPVGDETLFEVVMSATQRFSDVIPTPPEYLSRMRNIHADYRLCCAGPILHDVGFNIHFGFLITNDAIYVYYARRGSFTGTVLVKRRGSGPRGSVDILDDFYRLGIGVDAKSQAVNWYIGGERVFRVDRIGYRLEDPHNVLERGGSDSLVTLDQLRFGIGHYSFLDHQLPHNYAREMIQKDTESEPGVIIYRSASGLYMLCDQKQYRENHPDVYGQMGAVIPEVSFATVGGSEKYRIFGQGVISMLKSLKITTFYRETYPYEETLPDEKMSEQTAELETCTYQPFVPHIAGSSSGSGGGGV